MSRINIHIHQKQVKFFFSKQKLKAFITGVYFKIFKKKACKKANQVKVLATKSDDPEITWKDQTNSLKL